VIFRSTKPCPRLTAGQCPIDKTYGSQLPDDHFAQRGREAGGTNGLCFWRGVGVHREAGKESCQEKAKTSVAETATAPKPRGRESLDLRGKRAELEFLETILVSRITRLNPRDNHRFRCLMPSEHYRDQPLQTAIKPASGLYGQSPLNLPKPMTEFRPR